MDRNIPSPANPLNGYSPKANLFFPAKSGKERALLYPDLLAGGEGLTQRRRDSLRNAEKGERKCSSPPRCSAPSASLRLCVKASLSSVAALPRCVLCALCGLPSGPVEVFLDHSRQAGEQAVALADVRRAVHDGQRFRFQVGHPARLSF